jgi:hypothetical protein
MYYKGTVALTPGVLKVLGGASDAKTTEWGDSFVTFDFEVRSAYIFYGIFADKEGRPALQSIKP